MTKAQLGRPDSPWLTLLTDFAACAAPSTLIPGRPMLDYG